MGERISDQEFKSILIMSLPDSWEAFTSSYQGSNVKRLRGLQQPQAQMSFQELSSVGISRGWALPLGSRVGVPAGTGTGQGPDTRALANGSIFTQNGLELAEI